jgi:hypothetical protein
MFKRATSVLGEDLTKMKRLGFAVAVSALLAATFVTPVGATNPPYTIIASGFHSPRGLAFGPGDRLYVGQAGLGAGNGLGFGMTSSIGVIRHPGSASPAVGTVVGGLPSLGDAEGTVGLDGVSVMGNGNIYGIEALSNANTGIPGAPLGRLIKVTPSGQTKIVADVGAFDYAWSQAHLSLAPRDFPDTNPYGVVAAAGRTFVLDAGTNTLDEVEANGSLHILAFFPNNRIADATPTCAAFGPDGALYVGTLALVDSFVLGPSAIVYRVDLKATNPASLAVVTSVATPWATGLWPMNGCAFGPDGSFYASELFTSMAGGHPSAGDVVRIPWGQPTTHHSMTGGTLTFPGGVAVAADGAVYVANMSVSSDGEVVRLH